MPLKEGCKQRIFFKWPFPLCGLTKLESALYILYVGLDGRYKSIGVNAGQFT